MRVARLVALTVCCLGSTAVAQVGHDPERSPFRSISRSKAISFGVGYVWGSRGVADVGPSDGLSFTGRFDIRLSGPTDANLSITYLRADRFLQDPTLPADVRKSGPVSQDVWMFDLGLIFLLTGTKTWHGIAPYLGFSLGLATAASPPQDRSGYEFGTRFTLQPTFGVRFYPSDKFFLRLEIRDLIWQLRYPITFFGPPPAQPDLEPILNPLRHGETDWTHQIWLSAGLGFAFRL